MARSFDIDSSQYLEIDSTPITAAPFTVAAWARVASDAAGATNFTVAWIGDKDLTADYWALDFAGYEVGDPV